MKKIIADNLNIIPDTVDMARWTHNTDINVNGYTPMQLGTGKCVILPGITQGNMTTESQYEDEGVRNIMERHSEDFREQEFVKKLEKAAYVRIRGYENII